MKKLFVCLGVCMIVFVSCNKTTPEENYNFSSLDEKERVELIDSYTNSVNSILSKTEVNKSLVYTLGDYSFYVSSYSRKGELILLIEHGSNGEYGEIEKRYYLANEKPVFYQEKRRDDFPTTSYYLRKTYFKGAKPLLDVSKQAVSNSQLSSTPFGTSKKISAGIIDEVKTLKDALKQRGKFDLVFFGITENPNAKYLILGKQEVNAYRAPIQIKKDDELTKALTLNPEKYRGRKLDVNWKTLSSNNAVYVSGTLD